MMKPWQTAAEVHKSLALSEMRKKKAVH